MLLPFYLFTFALSLLSAIRSTLNSIDYSLPAKRHTIYDTLFVLYLSYSVSNWPSSEFLPIRSSRKKFSNFFHFSINTCPATNALVSE